MGNSDARLIVLALVVNGEGFLKYSNIFEGNMADSKTLGTVIETLGRRTSYFKIQRLPLPVCCALKPAKVPGRYRKHTGCDNRQTEKPHRAFKGKVP